MCQLEKEKIEFQERSKIVAETARINWKDIEVFYAKGMAILVSPDLDLIQVAHTLSSDDKEKIESWINSGQLLRSFDEIARAWSDDKAEVWGVVIRPWVLVQEVKPEQ